MAETRARESENAASMVKWILQLAESREAREGMVGILRFGIDKTYAIHALTRPTDTLTPLTWEHPPSPQYARHVGAHLP